MMLFKTNNKDVAVYVLVCE